MQLIILTSVRLLRMRQRSTVRPWVLCSPAGKRVTLSYLFEHNKNQLLCLYWIYTTSINSYIHISFIHLPNPLVPELRVICRRFWIVFLYSASLLFLTSQMMMMTMTQTVKILIQSLCLHRHRQSFLHLVKKRNQPLQVQIVRIGLNKIIIDIDSKYWQCHTDK